MRICLLLFGSLAVVAGLPVQDWAPVEVVDVSQRERSPLLGDLLPQQGHVVQEDPKPVAQEKAAEPNPVKEKEQEKVNSEEKAEDKVSEKTEMKEEPVINKALDQEELPVEQLENMPKMVEEDLTAEEPVMEVESVPEIQEVPQRNLNEFVEEPVMELQSEKEETFVEQDRNTLEEEELTEVEAQVMEMQEVPQRSPNEFVEEPVMDQQFEKKETFVEQDRNTLEEEESTEIEAPVMEEELISETQEVYQRSPNEFVEEPGKDLQLEEEESFVEQDRNTLEEEEIIGVEAPVMEEEPISETQEVPQRNPNEFVEEPVMELQSEKQETFVEQDINTLEEEELMEVEAPVMEEEPFSEMQEVPQRSPIEFVEDSQSEEENPIVEQYRNTLEEEELTEVEAPVMGEEPILEMQEVPQRSPIEFVEDLQSEEEEPIVDSQEELLMQDQLQEESPLADPKMLEVMQGEELMLADETHRDNILMNDNLEEENTASDEESAQAAESGPVSYRNRWRGCTGVVIDGKCYVFFRGPKRAADAEYFCQGTFNNGHLASVTSKYIHSQMMWLMNRSGGPTRTWIGGLRYLDTGRFIWLDGAQWGYTDWLIGEPNNTAGVENCVELLRDGKFNDMPCWDLRAFICSYTL